MQSFSLHGVEKYSKLKYWNISISVDIILQKTLFSLYLTVSFSCEFALQYVCFVHPSLYDSEIVFCSRLKKNYFSLIL